MIMKPNDYKLDPYNYGDTSPRTWQDTAEVLKARTKPKPKGTSLHDRVASLEANLKGNQHAS